MSSKCENCLTFVLRWSFIIIIFTILFLCGFSFIYYSKISLDNKISSFFSFISTFGILATIGVYFWQKKDASLIENYKIEKQKESIKILILDAVSNFHLSFESTKNHLLWNDTKNALRQIDNIDTTIISKCLYDASNVDNNMFKNISELNIAIIEYKLHIMNKIENYNNGDDNAIKLAVIYCKEANKEINNIYKSIIR
ncbi:hypothetical protein [Proteus terrae]|uniref:hypothetical protein n=1 Tax=Proteus terrae TaxID=1574161 RepID=UPI001F2D4F0B|nr:hypothetical protein [Proteus terrae]